MKNIIKFSLFLGMIPLLCSLTKEQKFSIVRILVDGVNMPPIQNMQCDCYDLKSFDGFYTSPYGEAYSSVCEEDHDCFMSDEDGRYIGLDPRCDSKFMYSSVEASRHDTIFDVYIFYKGPRYYIVANPSAVSKGEEHYTIGDLQIPLDDSIRCDSCLTVFLDRNVPFRTDTCMNMPTTAQTHILSQRTVLRICESEMYEKMSPDSFPAKKCWGVFDDSEADDIYVDYVDTRPEFPGGQNALLSYWKKKLSANKSKITEGSFHIVFLIDSNGEVKSPRIKGKEKGHLTKSEIELLHLAEDMPRWNPGQCKNGPVQTKEMLCLKIGRKGEVLSISK